MKKLFFAVLALSIVFTGCKSETKKEEKTQVKQVEETMPFSLKTAQNTIDWTAYKTTAKVAVNGKFKKVNITNGGSGNSVKEAVNGTEFSIPVSSIFTKDESRDFKIRKFFFGVMENTTLLSGKISLNDDNTGTVKITMNGVTQKLPFSYKIEGKTFSMNATMDINNWNAQKALASLNEACKVLHTGADGVSKTWSEVALNISSTFK